MGKLVVVSRDRVGEAAVKLITPETGKLFAVALVRRDGPPAAEKVTDSSRYFALRIENDKGASVVELAAVARRCVRRC